jgi:hypothetical protein
LAESLVEWDYENDQYSLVLELTASCRFQSSVL